jgi:hypothetical protein
LKSIRNCSAFREVQFHAGGMQITHWPYSRILDADISAESLHLARSNILVQGATAMLAQANQSAQSLLKLLL